MKIIWMRAHNGLNYIADVPTRCFENSNTLTHKPVWNLLPSALQGQIPMWNINNSFISSLVCLYFYKYFYLMVSVLPKKKTNLYFSLNTKSKYQQYYIYFVLSSALRFFSFWSTMTHFHSVLNLFFILIDIYIRTVKDYDNKHYNQITAYSKCMRIVGIT